MVIVEQHVSQSLTLYKVYICPMYPNSVCLDSRTVTLLSTVQGFNGLALQKRPGAWSAQSKKDRAHE